jgi:hypothetical protein
MNRDPEKIQAGIQAGMTVIEETRQAAREMGLTPERSLQVILAAHDATEIRPHYDKDKGEFVYSKPLVDHQTRLRAAEMNMDMVHGIKVDRLDITSGGTVIRTGSMTADDIEIYQAIGAEILRIRATRPVDNLGCQPLGTPVKGAKPVKSLKDQGKRKKDK